MKTTILSSHGHSDFDLLFVRTMLLACLFYCSFAFSAEQQKSKATQGAQHTNTEQRGTENSPLFVRGEVIFKKDIAEADSNAKEREEKLYLDSSLVKYTLWLAVGTFALFIAAAIQAGLFVWQLRLIRRGEAQTKKVAEAAKASANAALGSLRPWLSCEVELAEPLTFNAEGDAVFSFHFHIKNIGHSPAISIDLHPFMDLFEFHNLSRVRLKEMADWNRDMGVDVPSVLLPGGTNIGREQYGLIIFPGQSKTFNYRIPLKRADLEKSCAVIKPNMNFFPEVFAIVTYSYPSATIRSSTAIARMIRKIGGAFELDKPAGLNEIALEDDTVSGDFAT